MIHNCLWFFDYINYEETLGPNTMILLGTDGTQNDCDDCVIAALCADDVYHGAHVAQYLETYHPTATTHLMQGWRHVDAISKHRHTTAQVIDQFMHACDKEAN